MNYIEIKNVSKTYGKKNVLKNVSFNIHNGMFGLLGHNGAGKTTLMKIMTTLVEPNKGKVFINDIDVSKNPIKVKEIIGFLPQEFNLYNELNAVQMLDYIARLNGIKSKKSRNIKIDEMLERVNLKDACKERLGGYSGGMKRRLGIALSLVKDPKVLIVDEPTAGLDPEERVRFRTMLVNLSEDKIVILSTHIVEDISASCDQMVLLNKGKVDFVGNPDTWLQGVNGKIGEICIEDRTKIGLIEKDHHIISLKQVKNGVLVRVMIKEESKNERINIVQPNLEDAYLYYTNLKKENIV
ncbi:ABC transporter ATP-binding protein [Tepidibacter mesophilus]|uniref:ABC transporter ATP-binding protein n=1 Tax=Tepidibacter mesophilus TaxID=655607 RepID=UPI001FA829AB|nr:ABC transporter ATP-binding protein [Tepidibacter mesophilus]